MEKKADDSIFIVKSQKGYLAKNALFDAAIGLIAEHGINGFSISTLCKQAGLRRTSFYTYFKTIDDLIDELALKEDADFEEELEEEVGKLPFGVRRLSANILKFYKTALNNAEWNKFVLQLFMHHNPTRELFLSDIMEDVRQGINNGDLNISENEINCFTALITSTLTSVNDLKKDNNLEIEDGPRMVSMLLKAGGADQKLINEIIKYN